MLRCLRAAARAAPPRLVLALFVVIAVLNYVDRGIVPGAFDSIEAFIRADSTVGPVGAPDLFLGLLQSFFIAGYSAASLGLGHAASVLPAGPLVAAGLAVWVAAVVCSGAAGSYVLLCAARALSGVGEAAFQLVVPPWVEDHAPPQSRGLWLSLLYMAIPVGTALGYTAGGAVSWRACFIAEGLLVLPLLPLVWVLELGGKRGGEEEGGREEGGGARGAPKRGAPEEAALEAALEAAGAPAPEAVAPTPAGAAATPSRPSRPSFGRQLALALCDPVYSLAVLGYAGLTAVLAGVGAFGPAFLQGLGFVACQADASFMFGAVISAAGLLGTLLGGLLLDRHLSAEVARVRRRRVGRQPPPSGSGCVGGGGGGAVDNAAAPDGGDDTALLASPGYSSPGSEEDAPGAVGGGGGGWRGGHADDADDATGDDAVWLTHARRGRALKLRVCLQHSTLHVALGSALLLCALPAARLGVAPFMAAVAAGTTAFFAATAPINLATMACGAPESRPFAVGLSTLLVHAAGDTPAPAIIGALAGALSPQQCPPAAAVAAVAAAAGCPTPCPRSRDGLLTALALVIAWLGWPCVLWAAAWLLARRRERAMAGGAAARPLVAA